MSICRTCGEPGLSLSQRACVCSDGIHITERAAAVADRVVQQIDAPASTKGPSEPPADDALREAFMAGVDYGLTAGGWFNPKAEEAYTTWRASRLDAEKET